MLTYWDCAACPGGRPLLSPLLPRRLSQSRPAQSRIVIDNCHCHCYNVSYHKEDLHSVQCTIVNGQIWEGGALLIDGDSINCNLKWFLLWFGVLLVGWLVEAELDTFATSKSHLRHELVRQLTETQNTEKKISYCVIKGSATHWKGLQKQNWKS